jgi:hypothetical protein
MPFEVYVWLAWSIKEAAFKYFKRQAPDLIFSPTKINIQRIHFPEICTLNEPGYALHETTSFSANFTYQSVVQYGSAFLSSQSVISRQFIYSVVNEKESFDNIWWGIKAIEFSNSVAQSAGVRSFILEKLYALFPGLNMKIDKSRHGYPLLLNGEKEMNIPISFTHDHHYAAYSFVLSDTCLKTD